MDARIERVRVEMAALVRQKALLVAYGVHETGRREVISVAVGEVESEAGWRGVLREIVARSMTSGSSSTATSHWNR